MVQIPSLCSKDDQTAKSRSIKWPQALITTPKLYESWKICHGRKIYCLVERSAACNTAVLRAHVCAHAGGIPGIQGLMQEVSAIQNVPWDMWMNTRHTVTIPKSQLLSSALSSWRWLRQSRRGGDSSIFWLLLILPVRQHQRLVLKNFLSIYPLLPLCKFSTVRRILLGCKRVGG